MEFLLSIIFSYDSAAQSNLETTGPDNLIPLPALEVSLKRGTAYTVIEYEL